MLGDLSVGATGEHASEGGEERTFVIWPRGRDADAVEQVYIVLPNYFKDLLLAYNWNSIRGILCAHYYLRSD